MGFADICDLRGGCNLNGFSLFIFINTLKKESNKKDYREKPIYTELQDQEMRSLGFVL